jgi:hypothetical protein
MHKTTNVPRLVWLMRLGGILEIGSMSIPSFFLSIWRMEAA